jgi:hypothetical protein
VVGFHPVDRLTALDVAEVLATVEPRITRLLDRRGLGEGDDEGGAPDAWADEAPVMDAFFSTVKNEVGEWYESHGAAKGQFDYIEVFYNQRRRHSSAGRMSPAAFERRMTQAA